jgi:heme-degrading monooxygenase HmoA
MRTAKFTQTPGGVPMPTPPYFAVIFTSRLREQSPAGYGEMAQRMDELAREQPGFLGLESARGADGLGITISYWATLADVANWGRNAEHLLAQKLGREKWYQWYSLRVSCVEREVEFSHDASSARD